MMKIIMYASLYPSIIREFNVAAHTQIGMIIIPDPISIHENRQHDPAYSRGGQFLEDFRSHQWLEIGTRWFNLANFTELVNDVIVFYTEIAMPMRGLRLYNPDGTIQPMHFCTKPNLPQCVMIFEEDIRTEHYEHFNFDTARMWRENAIQNPNQLFR